MGFFKSFSGQIICGLILYLLMLTINSVSFYRHVEQNKFLTRRIENLRWPTSKSSANVEMAIYRSLAALRGWLLLKEPRFKNDRIAAWQIIDSSLEMMRKLSREWTNPKNSERLAEILPLMESFRSYQGEVERASFVDVAKANLLLGQKTAPAADKILRILSEMVEDQKGLAVKDIESMEDLSREILAHLGVFLVSSFIFLGILGFFLVFNIVKSLKGAMEAADRISASDLDSGIDLTGPTEIVSLGKSLENMRVSLQEYNKTLRRANEELEEFAFIASHDLKAPVRHIKMYVDVLKEETEAGNLSADAREAMKKISVGTVKMKRLIEDLLNYSRVSRAEMNFEEVNLAVLVKDVLDMLQPQISENRARIMQGGLPKVKGMDNMLSEVFENLIGNAIKYQPAGRVPEVAISCVEGDDEVSISVADNGIGIPEDKREYVFEIFKRLHKTSEYEGTGIGLAICKRVAELHGGNIRAEVSDWGGSRFVFTIMKDPSKES